MKKSLFFFIYVICATVFSSVNAFSASYPDKLRVGIYYDSSAVQSLSLSCANGFSVGSVYDRSFSAVLNIPQTEICAKQDTLKWHVSFGSFADISSASAKVSELAALGADTYIAYLSSGIYVLHGSFETENDAAWAANNLPAGGAPLLLTGNLLRADDVSNGRILFLFERTDSAFGIFGKSESDTVTIDGAAGGAYRGGFELRLYDGGKITVTNIVPVEEYLCGVVSREMSPSWNIEALKAQAVCARNFSLGRIGYHSKFGFDVCRTTCCQAYSGISAETDAVSSAVGETRGELLFFDGEPIQAVYSSSMGSCTESVENVWGTPYPYLVSVDNPYEDTENIYNGKWTKTLTRSRATEIMNSRGYSVGEVTDINALEYTAAGRVLKLLVRGTQGEKIFEREACRSIFSEVTYSQKYTVTKGGTSSYPSVFCTDGNGASIQKTLKSVSVLSKDGIVTADGNIYIATDGSRTADYSPTFSGDDDTFIFDGEGWGHGVGMSQYGAKGMADAGFKYSDILTHYYTGTYLEKAY